MPIAFACPSCGAHFQVDDSLGGKKCKCTRCGSQFLVPAAAPVAKKPIPPPPAADDAPRKRSRAAAAEDDDRPRKRVRDDEDEDDRPRSKRRKDDDDENDDDKPRSKRRKDDDDEDDDDKPRRRYHEEDDDDDLPRRSRRKKRKSKKVLVLAIGGAVGLVCLLVAGGLIWYFFSSSGPGPDVKYLPSGSQIVASVKVEELLGSKAYKQFKDEFPELQKGMDLDKMEAEIGLPLKNVSSLLVGGGESGGKAEFVAAVRTIKSVKANDLLANMKEGNFKEEKVGRYTMYTRGSNAFCVPESNVVLYSEPETLKKVLERDKKPEFSDGLNAAIKETDFSKTVAMAMNIKDLLRKQGNGRGDGRGANPLGPFGGSADIFKDAEGFAASISVKSDISWKMSLIFKDSKSAADGKKVLDAAVVVAKKDKNVPPAVADMMGDGEYKVSGKNVENAGKIETTKLIKLIKALKPGGF